MLCIYEDHLLMHVYVYTCMDVTIKICIHVSILILVVLCACVSSLVWPAHACVPVNTWTSCAELLNSVHEIPLWTVFTYCCICAQHICTYEYICACTACRHTILHITLHAAFISLFPHHYLACPCILPTHQTVQEIASN